MIEIRWHARAGQGAKTAAQLEAMAMLRAGRWVQAFPEYGPERSGAPMLAYTRVDDARIRRRYAVTSPDVVVVLDPSLLLEADVTAGLAHDGRLLINTSREPADVAAELRCEADVRCVPAGDIAAAHDSRYVNVVMLGALAGVLREPPLDDVLGAAHELFGRRFDAGALRALEAAISEGFEAAALEPVS